MIDIFRKRRIEKYTQEANRYAKKHFEEPNAVSVRFSLAPKDGAACEEEDDIQYSLKKPEADSSKGTVRYSISGLDDIPANGDRFRLETVDQIFAKYSLNSKSAVSMLDANLNLTFTDMMIRYIAQKGWRDSKVYKAAQMDRRLFSKIMSDREYKPSKDTALSLAIALELSLQQTNDLLSRAGYTLSHSSKRDVIIEYFIREGVHDLMDINEVLLRMEQKTIGR